MVLDPDRPRNQTYVDWWSLTHVVWSALLAVLIGPLFALVIMTLWEPLEVLVLSPWFARRGVEFGHESLRNSLMDVAFNTIGVVLAVMVILPYTGGPAWMPPWP